MAYSTCVIVEGLAADSLDRWQARPSPLAAVSLHGLTFAGGSFVAVGDAGAILTSPDGVNWTPRHSGTADDLLAITYGRGLFVAIEGPPTILTSPDVVLWTSRDAGQNWRLNAVAYGWAPMAGLGVALFVIPRLLKTELLGARFADPVRVEVDVGTRERFLELADPRFRLHDPLFQLLRPQFREP
jgi:hypothetical protein